MRRCAYNSNWLVLAITVLVTVTSCRQIDVYEKNKPIPHFNWKHTDTATGSFEVKEPAATYNIYIVLRHMDAYAYNNIWLNIGLQNPGDTMVYQKVDLRLASDATGWEGSGMNDIWEVRKLVSRREMKPGIYKFRINHIMREDPLSGVMSAGMRIEKQQ